MTSAQTPDTDVDTAIDVHVENVGGISDADVTLRPGEIGRASCRERVFRAV